MMNPDLKRSFEHMKRHEELEYLKLNCFHKLFLAMMFFILLPCVMLDLFLMGSRSNKKKIYVLRYKDKEPYSTVMRALERRDKFKFVKLPNLYMPVLPPVFIKDIAILVKTEPVFMLKNLYFFGALSLKISKYYSMVKLQKITNLIVFQEYSFYMSYLTRIMESDGGNLYNVQHGTPGATYCHFRFSKCFIWGEYYKEVYIKNKAEPSQFVITGSIFHDNIKRRKLKEDIDVLYIMQGKFASGTEDVLDILEELSSTKVVRCLQHPRHPISIRETLQELDDNIMHAILRSKVIVSHYSTGLLDACYLNKYALSYTKAESDLSRYVPYLASENIVHTKAELRKKILTQDELVGKTELSKEYIDTNQDPIAVIENEIAKSIRVE